MARSRAPEPVLVKKYGNRRLYDTSESRYVTLDELEARIRGGTDVRVVDARSGADLTQPTLAQIILEGRGAGRMLPVPLLTQLIRLGDEALAEFVGRWVSGALEAYLQARQGAQSLASYNPFATMPFDVAGSLARLFLQRGGPGVGAAPPPPPEPAPAKSEVDALRQELEDLKASLGDARSSPRRPAARRPRPGKAAPKKAPSRRKTGTRKGGRRKA